MVPSKESPKPNAEKKEKKESSEEEEEELGEEEEEDGMVIDEGELEEVVGEDDGEDEGVAEAGEEGEEVTGEMVVQGEEGLYQVERILAKRMTNANVVEYLIKWDGEFAFGFGIGWVFLFFFHHRWSH